MKTVIESTNTDIRVCLVAEKQLLREGIISLLKNDLAIAILEAEQLHAVRDLANIDVLLIACRQPFDAFVNDIKKIIQQYPKIKIIVLSIGEDDLGMLKSLLEIGVSGYLTENASREELSHSIRKVCDDGLYVCTAFVMRMLKSPQHALQKKNTISELGVKKAELDVLKLIADGLTNHEIALKLFVSVRTIENRRKLLLQKTGTTNTATLIRFAVQNNLIS